MILLDSSTFIAASNPRDENFERGKNLLSEVFKSRESIMVTSHVFDEITTFIRKKVGAGDSIKAAGFLTQGNNIEIFMPEAEIFKKALGIFLRHSKLSFCDSLSLAFMDYYGISKILSFDSDFDGIPGIQRIG